MANSNQFWKDWAKPWAKEQCERCYIQSEERISVARLSELSGVPESTLTKWANRGTNGVKWKRLRDEYHQQVAEQTREKAIEKTSDLLSDELAQLAIEHLEAYKICRRIATLQSAQILSKLERAFAPQTHPELEADDPIAQEFADTLKDQASHKVNVMIVNMLSTIIDRSVRGERMSASMDYLDLNKAIATVQQAGLTVTVDDNEALKQISAAEVHEEDSGVARTVGAIE